MFDLFRSREKSVRILLAVILLLVAGSMLIYLVPGGFGGGTSAAGDNVVAAVGSEKITDDDVRREVQRQIERITQGRMNLPKGMLAMYVPTIVNQMIENKAMAYKAREMGLSISDQELGDSIQSAFAAQAGGKFDLQQYQAFLGSQGLTVARFEKEQRDAMLGGRLETLQRQSLVVSDEEAKAEYQRKNLKVGLQYIDFEGKDFVPKIVKDPAAIKSYFERNRGEFRVPEKRDGGLVVGATADFMQSAQVSDAGLQKEYADSIDSFRTPERVRVRHILLKTQGKPKEEAPKMKAKAEDLLKQIKSGVDFAELAKKNSEDPGSGAKGGELGWIVRGQTVPNFEKTAFSLAPGELSGVIETEYGYHILQLEEKQTAHTQSFDEAKPQLLMEAKKQIATANLEKAIDAAHAEVLKNPAQAESIAAKYNLKFFKLDHVANSAPLPEVGAQPALASAIFSTPKGFTTDVVNMDAQGKASFAVVTNIFPARNAEYNEVENDVNQKFGTAEASRLAMDAAKSAADRARKGESLDAIAKAYGLTVKTAAPFTVDGAAEGIGSGEQLAAAFKANVGDIVGPVSAQAGQFVCKVSQKIPADLSQFGASKAAMMQSIAQQKLQTQQPLFRDSVVSDLKRRGKIKVNDATVSRIIGSYES